MHSASIPTRVLCISRDPQLLSTRQMIFETRYDAVSIGSVDAMWSTALGEFDCLILCHSLTDEECENAVAYARLRWPRIKIVALTNGESNCLGQYDRSVRGLDGPRVLLRTMEHLLTA